MNVLSHTRNSGCKRVACYRNTRSHLCTLVFQAHSRSVFPPHPTEMPQHKRGRSGECPQAPPSLTKAEARAAYRIMEVSNPFPDCHMKKSNPLTWAVAVELGRATSLHPCGRLRNCGRVRGGCVHGVPEERACWALRVQVLQTVQRRRGAAFDPTGENSRVGDARWERAEKQFEIQGTLLRS